MTDQIADGSNDRFDVAVIGAGQAAFAMGYFLSRSWQAFSSTIRAARVGIQRAAQIAS